MDEQDKERIIITISESLTEDALRTEPDYTGALFRLQDKRTIRLLHAAMGMATEAGEFLDMLKKYVYYGKPLDTVNAIEEIGDSTWYERIACDELDVEYLEMVAINIRKLKKRFPDKFSETHAIKRNTAAERRQMEEDLSGI